MILFANWYNAPSNLHPNQRREYDAFHFLPPCTSPQGYYQSEAHATGMAAQVRTLRMTVLDSLIDGEALSELLPIRWKSLPENCAISNLNSDIIRGGETRM